MFQFPEDDLMNHLVDLYFKYINPFLPLLHKVSKYGNDDDNANAASHSIPSKGS